MKEKKNRTKLRTLPGKRDQHQYNRGGEIDSKKKNNESEPLYFKDQNFLCRARMDLLYPDWKDLFMHLPFFQLRTADTEVHLKNSYVYLYLFMCMLNNASCTAFTVCTYRAKDIHSSLSFFLFCLITTTDINASCLRIVF